MTDQLTHVLWLGGSPCSGKTTIARRLVAQHRLKVYHCDEELTGHLGRITPEGQPALHKWMQGNWDALWMQTAEALLCEAKAAYREHFQLALEDLRSTSPVQPILAEGTILTPDSVFALLEDTSHAAWIVPTPRFQRDHYLHRAIWVQEILDQCSDPQAAFENWMRRDIAFAVWVKHRCEALGLHWFEVDGQQSVELVSDRLAAHYGLD